MVNDKVIAAGVLNHYVWALLEANTSMTEADYIDTNAPRGRIPIVPSGQEPRLVAINKPFIVYGFSEDATSDLYANRWGSLSYAVWSSTDDAKVSEVNQIMNIIRGSLERRDESAREINSYTDTIPGFEGIRFASTHISYFESPSPEETEGGRAVGIITIRYYYFVDYDVKRFVNGLWV